MRSPALLRFSSAGFILLAAALASAPLMVRGPSCGHDFDFHLVSWLDTLQNWRQGVLYPHWAPSANFGAGEPRFVFYPPLTWMLGAVLGAVVGWNHVPLVLTFLLLAAAGFATRALAQQAMSDGPATLAGCLAIFSGYALFTVYERSAYAELAGGFWIPLMLLLVLRGNQKNHDGLPERSVRHQAWDGSATLLALVIAGAWLSNAPVGVMATYLLAAFAIAVAVLSRSWAPVLRGATGAALGLGLAGFYLVPAAWEQRWIDIRQAVDDPGLLIENSFLFARHANPLLKLHDAELQRVSYIVLSMFTATVAGILVSRMRHRLPGKRWWWGPLVLIPFAVFLLQLPVSLPLWNAFPKLRFLQFPWRWLVVLEAPMAIFWASAAWMVNRWRRGIVIAIFCLFFAAALTLTGMFFHQSCDVDDAVEGMLQTYRTGVGFTGTDEYAPPGADNTLVAAHQPAACLVEDPLTQLGTGEPDVTPEWRPTQGSCEAIFPFVAAGAATTEHKSIQAELPHAGYLILRMRSYPAWNVRVNGRVASGMPQREDGLMAVPVPGGPVRVTVDWSTTRDVLWGRWMSILALAFAGVLWVVERRWSRPQL